MINNEQYLLETTENNKDVKDMFYSQINNENTEMKRIKSNLQIDIKLDQNKFKNSFNEENKNLELNKLKNNEQICKEIPIKLKRSKCQTNLQKSTNHKREKTIELDESIMEVVLKNFEEVKSNKKNKLKEMLSKEYLETISVESKSRRESLMNVNR